MSDGRDRGNFRSRRGFKGGMRRWQVKLFSLLLTLGYSWVSAASPGFVICVGTDGHLALEPTVDRHCQEPQPLLLERQDADREGVPALTVQTCVDTPLPSPLQNGVSRGGAGRRAQPQNSPVCPGTIGFAALSATALAPVPDPHCWRASASRQCPALPSLTTLVLRL